MGKYAGVVQISGIQRLELVDILGTYRMIFVELINQLLFLSYTKLSTVSI